MKSSQARVDMALGTIERAEKLTGQLLAFARRQPLTVARVDLNALLRRMTELLARTVGSGIRIATYLASDLWTVDADATQLELAVINLAINARDAMPSGGVLSIRTFNTTLPGGTGQSTDRRPGVRRVADLGHWDRNAPRGAGPGVRAVLHDERAG